MLGGKNFRPTPFCRSTVVLHLATVGVYEQEQLGYTPYKSVKEEWLKEKGNGANVVNASGVVYKGVRYTKENADFAFDHEQSEKKVADWLSNTFNKEVKLVPRVNAPEEVSTPDYEMDGKRIDLKRITGNGKATLYDALKGTKEQADHFIFDLTNTEMNNEKAMEQVEGIFKTTHRKWVNVIILKRNNELIEILKRN